MATVAEIEYSPLSKLCDSERGITYGIVKVGEFVEGGVTVIRGGDIRDGRIVVDVEKKVSEEISRQFKRTILRGGEIVINLIAEPGHTAIVPREFAGANVSRDVGVIPLNNSVDHRYVDYYLKSPQAIQWLTARLQGSVTQKINLATLSELPVPILPLEEQNAISQILGSLDEKIELNRRMNDTLEALGRAIFKSWFVDFDPVHAKAEGRDPGLPKHIIERFPDRFVESELGEFPEGWEVYALGELMELAYGKGLKENERNLGQFPVYGSNGQVGWHDERLVVGPGIVVGRKGNPGTVTWVSTDFFAIDTTFYVVPKSNCRSLYFLFHALIDQDLPSLSADSAVPGLNRNLAYMNKQIIPSRAILEKFDEQVRPLFYRVHRNHEESRTLAALRDTLLPKLISGELCISTAEKILQASP